MEFTAAMIAQLLNGTVEGDPGMKLHTIAKIEEGKPGALSFLANPKYEPFIYTTSSSAILVRNDFRPAKEIKATLIRVEDPYQSVARLLAIYEEAIPVKKGIHPSAVIDKSASIGKDVFIGPCAVIEENAVIEDGCNIYAQVFVGERARIGKKCTLHPGVKVYRDCVIGSDCILHGGVVIGSDGFGFAPVDDGNYMKIPQIGNVIIEDGVEIGSNTCIDRATMGSTLVQRGAKLDNLVQIAHNVVIGENTVIAAQSGIAGSTKIGKNCMLGGQVGIIGHLTIADGCKIGAQSGIMKSVTEENTTIAGSPSMESKKYMRTYAWYIRLPDLGKKVYELTKTVETLKNK